MPWSAQPRRRLSTRIPVAWLALVIALCMLGCSGKTKQAGGLEVILETDMPTPQSFDAVNVNIQQRDADGGWDTVANRTYLIPNDFTLPTTITLLAGSSPNEQVLLTVQALLGGHVLIERVVQAQVPSDWVGEVLVELSSKCLNVLSCPVAGDTCQPDLGACGPGSPATVTPYTPSVLLDAGVASTPADAGEAGLPLEGAAEASPETSVMPEPGSDASEDGTVAEPEDGGSDGAFGDPCATQNGGCASAATCTPAEGGARICTCNQGYQGNGMICSGSNACTTNNGGCSANAACASTDAGTNSCTCNTGYMGTGQTCTGLASCAANNGGCAATAKCTSTGADTNTCACNLGYMGNGMTCTPINSCATANGGCDANAICTSSGPGTNTCACNPGYSGTGAICAPIDSCATNNGGCSVDANCTSTGPGTNTCACNPGYSGTGATCTPILTVTGGTLVATTSLVMTGPIATVSDLDTGDPASALTATISWGDGQTTPGVALVGSNGAFTVSSSHVYAAAGTPSVTVTVTDPSTGASASATFTATVRPTSVITEFPVSVESYLGGITSFDGALWFADEGTSSIGVCTTSGAITEYAGRGTTDAPFAVAPGVNNDLWFVASSQNYVADMNTAGTVISENSPPAANSLPFALAAGSDGNMWMVQEAGYVSSIAPGSFAIAQYAVAAGTLYGIAAGADGNLWFTDSGNNAIRTINPTTHTISSYPIPTASSS